MTWGNRMLPFPHCLTGAHRRYIEAVQIHGTQEAAAFALGVGLGTLVNGLKKARMRAGVTTTPDLLRRYFNVRTL